MTDDLPACLIPANETQRLRALRSYDIIDTPAEVNFDILTRVAMHAINTPAAVIGLMDADRLWFKSQIGLGVPQLDRQIAFCAHAVMRPDELLVAPDLRHDARFRDNPLVLQAPFLRFYAGAPLVDRHGYALGTIAVVDTQPREFTDSQRVLLHDLSALVIGALENRQQTALLGQLAMTDHLTGLANRAQFERALKSELALADRSGDAAILFYMDLDGFNKINDSYGHAAGDEVLACVAQRMAGQVRAGDLLARFGGDEFGLLLRQGDMASAELLAARIADEVRTPITLSNGHRVSVSISIGIARSSACVNSMALLLANADQALYGAKRSK